jgi:hypothetical protein
MPVPDYLKELAYDESSKNNITTFDLKCRCGCVRFNVYESFLDKKEKELCKPYYDALEYLCSGGYGSSCTKDENGTIHHWKHLTSRRDGPKEEVIVPPKPLCACVDVIRAECSECGEGYVIFDSRYNGYSGKFCADPAEKEYIPHLRSKKRRDGLPVRVCISVEHDRTYEDFEKASGISCGYKEYTDAFIWITVYSIDCNGRKRKMFESETD